MANISDSISRLKEVIKPNKGSSYMLLELYLGEDTILYFSNKKYKDCFYCNKEQMENFIEWFYHDLISASAKFTNDSEELVIPREKITFCILTRN